jgi:hypothetical protein
MIEAIKIESNLFELAFCEVRDFALETIENRYNLPQGPEGALRKRLHSPNISSTPVTSHVFTLDSIRLSI